MAFSDDDVAALYALDMESAAAVAAQVTKGRVDYETFQAGFSVCTRTGRPRGRPRKYPEGERPRRVRKWVSKPRDGYVVVRPASVVNGRTVKAIYAPARSVPTAAPERQR